MNKKSFASDNTSGIHPAILKAITNANHDHAKAYGDDPYTAEAINLFKKHFGHEIDVYFVCNGTAANVLSLSTLIKPYHAIVCAESAHINVDECGAAEKYIGCKLITIPTSNGKLTVKAMENCFSERGNQHRVQPKVISISQTTEMATVYTADEIKKITDFAHKNELLVHMDGARISNAAASLGLSLKQFTSDVGIDVLSFGGTKNGMMIGEAIVFFNKNLSNEFPYIRKQGMQLVSKMRFISAQFIELLSNDLWLNNANHSNAMAKYLFSEIMKIPEIKLSREVQANAVFACLDPEIIAELQKHYYFYVWDELSSEVRWMTTWDTTKDDVDQFVACIKKTIK